MCGLLKWKQIRQLQFQISQKLVRLYGICLFLSKFVRFEIRTATYNRSVAYAASSVTALIGLVIWPLTFWPLNRFTVTRVMGFHPVADPEFHNGADGRGKGSGKRAVPPPQKNDFLPETDGFWCTLGLLFTFMQKLVRFRGPPLPWIRHGFHRANFGLPKPFRSRVRSRHATYIQTDGQTDRQTPPIIYGGRGHKNTPLLSVKCDSSYWQSGVTALCHAPHLLPSKPNSGGWPHAATECRNSQPVVACVFMT